MYNSLWCRTLTNIIFVVKINLVFVKDILVTMLLVNKITKSRDTGHTVIGISLDLKNDTLNDKFFVIKKIIWN